MDNSNSFVVRLVSVVIQNRFPFLTRISLYETIIFVSRFINWHFLILWVLKSSMSINFFACLSEVAVFIYYALKNVKNSIERAQVLNSAVKREFCVEYGFIFLKLILRFT